MIVGTGRWYLYYYLILLFSLTRFKRRVLMRGEYWLSLGIWIESDIHDCNNEDNEIDGNIGTRI